MLKKVIDILKFVINKYELKHPEYAKPVFICPNIKTRNKHKNDKYKIPEDQPQCPVYKDKLHMPAWYQAYAPYWVSKCKKGQDGRIRCDLLPEFCWDESCQVWIREDNGTWEFTSMLPPTMEMVRKEQEDMKCHRT